MIDNIISSESWDEVDFLAINLYKCTLKTNFGDLKEGYQFDCVFVDYGKGLIEFYVEAEDPEPCRKYKIGIQIEN